MVLLKSCYQQVLFVTAGFLFIIPVTCYGASGDDVNDQTLPTRAAIIMNPDSFDQSEQKVKQICQKMPQPVYPKHDLPSKADKESLSGCSSENLYYGIGIPVDYVKARKCAFIENESSNNDLMFGGNVILMMIYANGYGVKRNLNIAVKLACDDYFAPAEQVGRVEHLLSLKTDPKDESFDFCDDITSGYMQGFCRSLQADIDSAKRNQQLNSSIAKWPEQDQIAFKKLQQAAESYFAARSSGEVDLSGTARAAFEIDEQDQLEGGFLEVLQKFEKKQLPHYSATDFKRLDQIMNQQYRKNLRNPDFKGDLSLAGGVTVDGIKDAQRAWLVYRDAWVDFGAIHYQQVSADSWKAWLTQERIKQLKDTPVDF